MTWRDDTPKKGWVCTDVEDVCPSWDCLCYESCEMCGNYPIRFVHIVKHDRFEGSLRVGCICVEHMTDDYIGPKGREQGLKNKANRRGKWLTRKWRTSRKGNHFLKLKGVFLTVFPSKRGGWCHSIDGQFSPTSYPTLSAAKLALFEAYDNRACSVKPNVSTVHSSFRSWRSLAGPRRASK